MAFDLRCALCLVPVQAYEQGGVRRATGDIGRITGAAGLSYREYRTEAGPADLYLNPHATQPRASGGAAAKKPSEIAKKMHKKLQLPKGG